jgi:hypothetical protein
MVIDRTLFFLVIPVCLDFFLRSVFDCYEPTEFHNTQVFVTSQKNGRFLHSFSFFLHLALSTLFYATSNRLNRLISTPSAFIPPPICGMVSSILCAISDKQTAPKRLRRAKHGEVALLMPRTVEEQEDGAASLIKEEDDDKMKLATATTGSLSSSTRTSSSRDKNDADDDRSIMDELYWTVAQQDPEWFQLFIRRGISRCGSNRECVVNGNFLWCSSGRLASFSNDAGG